MIMFLFIVMSLLVSAVTVSIEWGFLGSHIYGPVTITVLSLILTFLICFKLDTVRFESGWEAYVGYLFVTQLPQIIFIAVLYVFTYDALMMRILTVWCIASLVLFVTQVWIMQKINTFLLNKPAT